MDSIVTEVPSEPLETLLKALRPGRLRPLRKDELYHLERLLRLAWRMMSPPQRACFAQSAEVASLLRVKGTQGRRAVRSACAAVRQGVAARLADSAIAGIIAPGGRRAAAAPAIFRPVG